MSSILYKLNYFSYIRCSSQSKLYLSTSYLYLTQFKSSQCQPTSLEILSYKKSCDYLNLPYNTSFSHAKNIKNKLVRKYHPDNLKSGDEKEFHAVINSFRFIEKFQKNYGNKEFFSNIYKETSDLKILKMIEMAEEENKNLETNFEYSDPNEDHGTSTSSRDDVNEKYGNAKYGDENSFASETGKITTKENFYRFMIFIIIFGIIINLYKLVPVSMVPTGPKESKRHRKVWHGKWHKRWQKHFKERSSDFENHVLEDDCEVGGCDEDCGLDCEVRESGGGSSDGKEGGNDQSGQRDDHNDQFDQNKEI